MSRLLGRLPALATFGVGSLPYLDEAAAVRHAARAYDVPFCPQLPALDGDMLSEWLGADPARCGWNPDRDRTEPRAWTAFTRAVADRPPAHAVVKLQVTGPLTLAAGLERAHGRPATGATARALATEVAGWIAANAAPRVRELERIGVETLLVVDEPGLAQLGPDPHHAWVWDALRGVAPAWGVHVCGPIPWDVIDAAEPDVISFDLARYGLEVEAADVIGRLTARGGRPAFGALDPVRPRGTGPVVGRTKAAIVSLARAMGQPVSEVAAASMLSPSCGTGRLSAGREHLVAAELGAAADELRAFVGSPLAATLHRAPWNPESAGAA